jgi:DNA-binding MarR family transcriptional regulator
MSKIEEVADEINNACVATRVRLLGRVITNLYDEALRPFDLKIGQLAILALAGKGGEIKPAKVAAELQLDPSTLSRNLERMVERGWIEASASDDRRSQPFKLTTDGKNTLRKALTAWRKSQEKATELLTKQGIGLIEKVTKSIVKDA